MKYILQDIKTGMFVKQRAFQLMFYCKDIRDVKASCEFCRKDLAEAFALEHGFEKEFIAIPKIPIYASAKIIYAPQKHL